MKKRLFYLIACLLAAASQVPGQAGSADFRISDDLTVRKLAEDVYLHTSLTELKNYGRISANGLIYTSEGKALIIDTPWTDEETAGLISWIEDTLHAAVTGVVVTHWHQDCMGGLAEVHRRHIISYGFSGTADIARLKELPVPVKTFSDSLNLKTGGGSCLCWFPGEGHTSDNIIVWIPGKKLLFGGCLVKSMAARGPGNTLDANMTEWPKTIQRLLDRYPDIMITVPGHGAPGGRELLIHTREILSRH